jgi:hercynylcysteine S-oxide lyase
VSLADRWRSARPAVAGLHLDSAACSRQSFAAIDAAAAHARHEAEIGGYVAAEAAEPVLSAGRAAAAALTGVGADDVVFTSGAHPALELLLASWPGERSVACLPGEYGPNLALLAAHGFDVRALAADGDGRADVDRIAAQLRDHPPALVHITSLASHRGLAQPTAALVDACRAAGVPVIVDAAQAFAHLDCAVGADAVYTSSRKWTAGPRGVGFLALAPSFAQRLRPRLPPSGWGLDIPVHQALQHGEANVAARVGWAVALGEHLDAGPAAVRSALAAVGALTRTALAAVPGWRVVEPVDEPTAITTLAPTAGADPARIRTWLIERQHIVTTAILPTRAPFELSTPLLRLSPHVDSGAEDLDAFAGALAAATREV